MKPIIISLDFENKKQTLRFLNKFANKPNLFVKIGMELFYSKDGPSIIQELHKREVNIFLDLKLYDIPNTVKKAAYQLAIKNIQLMTIHASGGSKMIKAAKKGLIEGSKEKGFKPAKLIAVTQLTSTSEKQMHKEQLIQANLNESVLSLAKLAKENGADGVVCSALENPIIHQKIGQDFLCLNPGIRLKQIVNDDQKRVVTPKEAIELKSNGIIVGRPIINSSKPVTVYNRILKEWNK